MAKKVLIIGLPEFGSRLRYKKDEELVERVGTEEVQKELTKLRNEGWEFKLMGCGIGHSELGPRRDCLIIVEKED